MYAHDVPTLYRLGCIDSATYVRLLLAIVK